MDDSNFLGELFDPKLLKVLELFLGDKNASLYLREVAQKTKVAPATTFRILNKLVELEVLKVSKLKRFKFYQLASNSRVEQLESLISKDPLARFIGLIKTIQTIQKVVLLGNAKQTGASVFIIGDVLNLTEIQQAAERIKAEYNYTIKYTCLTSNQFEQMDSMGVYSHTQKVLWKNI
jgi:DNA-binding transcriptional regulator YhcF (GntR family)